jgi:hypothetical protein
MDANEGIGQHVSITIKHLQPHFRSALEVCFTSLTEYLITDDGFADASSVLSVNNK